jgi:hypothetical protein
MTLILWKAPVVDDSTDAEALLKPYYEHGDDSAFEPSADIAKVASELLRRFPDAEDGPWADEAPGEEERVLLLTIRWGADNAVIDAITELAREHDLVLYDPQGPDVHLPSDPIETEPIPPPRIVDYLKIVAMGVVAAGVFWLGWKIDVPVLNWILMIIGGFFFAAVVFVFGAAIIGAKDE